MGKLAAIFAIVLLAACHPGRWVYHFGPHRLDVVDSFSEGGKTYFIYGCVKECPYRDTFPKPQFDK